MSCKRRILHPDLEQPRHRRWQPRDVATHTATGSPRCILQLARVERQSIMQCLSYHSLIAFGRCSRCLYADACHSFPWKHHPPFTLWIDANTPTNIGAILQQCFLRYVPIAGEVGTDAFNAAALFHIHNLTSLSTTMSTSPVGMRCLLENAVKLSHLQTFSFLNPSQSPPPSFYCRVGDLPQLTSLHIADLSNPPERSLLTCAFECPYLSDLSLSGPTHCR